MSSFNNLPDDDAAPLGPQGHDPLPPLPAGPMPDELGGNPLSALEELRGLVTTSLKAPTETYQVPTRPGWSVEYSAGIDGDQIRRWARTATPNKGPLRGELDQTKWACIVLASQSLAIRKNGENPTDQDQPLTFRDAALLELTGATGAADCVRLFYGGKDHIGDGHIVAQAYDLIKAAGYDENGIRRVDPAAVDGLEPQDPTGR